ncbi:MAG: Ig-like domain-containing protein, partial [Gemmatimonadota bacterium]|nr:Ig-like domain-containing protein [Gemmatimonadota bacterium]
MRFFRSAALLSFVVAASCDAAPTGGTTTPPTGIVGAVTSVLVTPGSATLFVGGSAQFSAVARDAAGRTVVTASVSWSSTDGTVASVNSSGQVSALKVGNATITATVSGISGSAAIGVQAPPAGSGDVIVNAGVTYQTMRGWEAHEQSAHEHPSFPQFKDELFDRAVNELGINRIRLEMWSGTEQDTDYYTQWLNGQLDNNGWRCKRFATVNDNGDPQSINWSGFQFSKIDKVVNDVIKPLQQRLQARGEQLHINLLYDAFTGQITGPGCSGGQYHHDDDPEEFAEFVLANFIHLRDDFGIVPQSFELLLEPNNTLWWTKGRQLGEALVATMVRLNANGFNPRVIAPSNSQAGQVLPFLDEIAKAPGALQLIDELSYHRYDWPANSVVQGIRARAAALGIETSMLEFDSGADQQTLYDDIVHGNVSAWQQFALAFQQTPPYNDKGGVYYIIDVANAGNPQVVMASRTRFLSQYFKYVREGAVRIGATSTTNGVAPLAFLNSNGKMVVVANITGSRSFTVGGLAAGTYDITYTTSSVLQASGGSVTIVSGQEIPVSV